MFIKAKVNAGNPPDQSPAGPEPVVTFMASDVSHWLGVNTSARLTGVVFKSGRQITILYEYEKFHTILRKALLTDDLDITDPTKVVHLK